MNVVGRYSQFDLTLAWEVKTAGNETVVEGVVTNNRYAFMDGIEVWIAVLDGSGKATARSVCYVMPHQVRQNESVPFAVNLPLHVEPGAVLKFTYKYQGTDGGEGGVNWVQSFEWTMP